MPRDRPGAIRPIGNRPSTSSWPGSPFHLGGLAETADLAGLAEVRDGVLRRFCDQFGATAPKTAQVNRMILDANRDGKSRSLDLKAVDEILGGIEEENRGNTAITVAAHLTAAGHPDEARRYWAMVADGGRSNDWWQVFAKSHLRNRDPKAPGDGKAGQDKHGAGKKPGAAP